MDRIGWVMGMVGVVCGLAGPLFAESDSKTVQVTATILPRLELTVTPETGESIAFGAITQPAPGGEAARSVQVSLNVFSNLDRPYHVTQLIRQPLSTAAGSTIPGAQFLVSARESSRGQLGPTQPTAITPGQPTTLYISDERGKSNAFLADYTLTVTPETPAGDFGTEIVYTVTSL
jgi:hypothetical protein